MFLLLGIALTVVAILLPACRICIKAGYPSWVGVFALVPGLNLVLLWFVAFSEWPLEKRVAALQATPTPAT
ncbi:MAG: hypothetical protein EPN53_01650 [Acidobacteria bacterium]|nr:MAG: hypothetical protein EPN53_01650 [Acidobacteriota bacterium]